MYITTNRLVIRNFENQDWQAVYAYTSDDAVTKYIPGGTLTEELTKALIDKNMNEDTREFAVLLAEEETLIGHIVFHKYFGEHTYEIGWVFNPRVYNRGYATEAALAILEYGFEKMNLHRIIATCQPQNTASYRVMEKIGMRREGHFKKCIPNGAEWWDEYYYAILREEWD